jgi:hypothetical protein
LGSLRDFLSIQFVKRRSGVIGLWKFICGHWLDNDRVVAGRVGFHVRGSAANESASLIRFRDPAVGAQYRWSASFAPANNAFWGLFQGIYLESFCTETAREK